MLKRAFLGWLRGEPNHCSMVAIPTLAEEDARRPNGERENLVGERTRIINRLKGALAQLSIGGFNPKLRHARERLTALRAPEGEAIPLNTLAELRFIADQVKQIETARQERPKQAPQQPSNAMVLELERVRGIGVETADMLAHELLSRNLRDQRAVAHYAGLTGSPDENGSRRREKGLAKAGNARVRRGMSRDSKLGRSATRRMAGLVGRRSGVARP